MTKNIILIISILSFSLSYGQYNWTSGKVILKNGDTLKGLLKIPMTSGSLLSFSKNKLEYKKDKKGKKKKFDKTEVHKIYFSGISNPDLGYYEYVPLTSNKMALFKLIRNGKVKLYIRTIKITVNTGFEGNNPIGSGKKVKKIKEYYMIRETEKVATRVFQESDGLSIAYKASLRTFKNYMKEYFSDCDNVLSYINDDLYEDFDVKQIIEDYNLLCE
ncbi:hypothetical protein [Winogradskyella pacifica]|uniref:hypothetical protein n=1 Tax=Winogradskyella pacifica TaxID=664642 RepID=UPI0015C77597|nr:hypothetical protein [Winogradskyella pacifica]